MLFASEIFIFLFLPTVLLLYYTILKKSRKWQNIFLTLVSLFFYAWGEPLFVIVMIGTIVIDYLFAIWVDKIRNNKRKSHVVLSLMLVVNLSIFFIFKYLGFAVQNINDIFGLKIGIPNIALPIGISFFMFQGLSYVIDVYREKGELQTNLLNVALYISFFPQLIAGPIVRYETIAGQIKNRKENFNDFSNGICRFVMGLGKKVILANTMAIIADKAFSEYSPSVVLAWMGAFAYTFQIYFDFAGYSDMAIGLGKMFGFHFLENFDYPYISKSISEFWRRWHISLGSWFKDYVYFPLGGSRVKTKTRLVFNLFVVWILTGIWHGANWTFVIWGLMFFVLISLEKLTGFDKKLKWFGHGYTLFFVVFGWVLFRSNNITHALSYIGNMFGLNSNPFFDATASLYLSENIILYLFAIILSFPIARFVQSKINNTKIINVFYPLIVIIIFLVSISYIVKGSYNPFIYFNF